MVYGPPVEWSSSGRRDEDIAALTQHIDVDHRGLGARDPRAVAVAAPAVEDAARRQPERASATRSPRDPPAEAARALGRPRSPSSAPGDAVTDPERILVRAPNWIGDVVLSLPALRDLRRRFPAARLEVLARPWVAELYRAVPEVDAIVESRGHAADVAVAAGPLRPRRPAPELVRHRARAVARGDPRALGLRDGRPRAAADARAAACRRASGAAARCTTIGPCWKAWGSRSRGRPTPRSRAPRSGPRGAAALLGDDGPVDRRQPRRLLRHGQALAARALRRRRRPRGPAHRGEGRDRGRRRGAAARRGDRRRSSRAPVARPLRARRRSPTSSAC